jgi:hypothetical protein
MLLGWIAFASRSAAPLEAYFLSLQGKGLVRVVRMDLASVYRFHRHYLLNSFLSLASESVRFC